jgi:penicillin-binding protein 1A
VRSLFRVLSVVVVAGVGLALAILAIVPAGQAVLASGEGKPAALDLGLLAERSLVYASDGTLLASLHAEQDRSPVALSAVPKPVVQTILAIEDDGFYRHKGVDLHSTLRALVENVESGGVEQGGSTITQQVVKNALLSPERNLKRKVKEAVLARRLEKVMSKDEILERYLNTVYFGNGAYGVQAAAETYFGEDVTQLSWPQAALLAGMIRNPEGYDPFRDPKAALERRRIVLDRLVETGRLTQERADAYEQEPLPEARHTVLPAPDDYFVEEVKQQLLADARLGATPADRYNAVFNGGLKIHTTFDLRAQFLAIAARDRVIPGTKGVFTAGRDPVTGQPVDGTVALASVDPATGAVRAMIGGPGFDHYKYNLATQGVRQPGSSFKVFVLTALLENGYVPSDTVNGSSPCSFPNPGGTPNPYKAENFEGSRGSTANITTQTLKSSNCAYLRLGQIVGLDKVVDVAHRMGITSPLDPAVISLPLGTMEVSPLEMAGAYAVIANDGVRNAPYLIDRVEDRDGKVLFRHASHPERVVSSDVARLAADVLRRNVDGGTGTRARLPGREAGGKTGTATDYADAWFVGFTRQLSTAIWMGAWQGKVPMRRVGGISVVGGSYPASMWGAYNRAYHEGLPVLDFLKPPSTRAGKYLRAPNESKSSSSSSGSSTRRRSSSRSTATTSPRTGTTAAPTTTAPSSPPTSAPPPSSPPVTPPPNPGGNP